MPYFIFFYFTGNCVLLDGTGDLNHFRCKDKFNEGCPTKPYNDDEIYKCKKPIHISVNDYAETLS